MKNFFSISDSKGTGSNSPNDSIVGLERGDSATIHNIHSTCTGLVRRRLLDLGFVPGTRVTKLGEGLFNGPGRYQIRGNVIALRPEQASQILTRSE